jgi:hypothetical protein
MHGRASASLATENLTVFLLKVHLYPNKPSFLLIYLNQKTGFALFFHTFKLCLLSSLITVIESLTTSVCNITTMYAKGTLSSGLFYQIY